MIDFAGEINVFIQKADAVHNNSKPRNNLLIEFILKIHIAFYNLQKKVWLSYTE